VNYGATGNEAWMKERGGKRGRPPSTQSLDENPSPFLESRKRSSGKKKKRRTAYTRAFWDFGKGEKPWARGGGNYFGGPSLKTYFH